VREEPTAEEHGVSKRDFSIARKGYDPAEVDRHLAESEEAFGDLEEYAARLKRELAEAKLEIARLKAAEQEAVDKAMRVVFEAKERILKQARLRANEIQDQARVAIDPDVANETIELPKSSPGIVEDALSQADIALSLPVEAAAPPTQATTDPEAALRQLREEADTIRSQLQDGMASAFDEMNRMQREAETRAAALLDEARAAAAKVLPVAGETIEVSLSSEADDAGPPHRNSRYSRNSARLPRIGDDAGESVLASMNVLRNKLREAEAEADTLQQPSVS
jgi:hypothetical protein